MAQVLIVGLFCLLHGGLSGRINYKMRYQLICQDAANRLDNLVFKGVPANPFCAYHHVHVFYFRNALHRFGGDIRLFFEEVEKVVNRLAPPIPQVGVDIDDRCFNRRLQIHTF